MKLSVCIDALYGGSPLRGIDATAEAGLSAFEFWGWSDKDIAAIDRMAKEKNLRVAAMCTRYFILNDPEKRAEFLEGLQASIPVAQGLGCPTLITQVGQDTGAARELQHESIVAGLKEAAQILEGTGVTLVIEPLNLRVNHAGYYLAGSDEAFEIVREVDSPSVKVLFDIYHQQVTEGDVVRRLLANLPLIGHFHAAGNPGRNELTRGEMNYRYIFEAIREAGYAGYVGLEYFPVGDALESLREAAALAGEV